MALRTTSQNKNLAQRILTNVGPKITDACEDTRVPTAFLAGLISVENAPLNANASRFESHIFKKLKRVRDGQLSQFNRIKRSDLSGATDAALKNLATSFGLTQIMGFHVIATFKNEITLNDLRDPEKHLNFGVQFIENEAGPHLGTGAFEKVLRIHNTGRPNGTTHDPNYVANALGVMRAYETLEG